MMKKNEKYIVLILLLIALCLYIFNIINKKEVVNVIVKDNNENILLSFNLNEDNYYELEGKCGLFHIEVKDGRCRAVDVDCPNQICVHTGWISVNNSIPIICLPNGIMVQIDE